MGRDGLTELHGDSTPYLIHFICTNLNRPTFVFRLFGEGRVGNFNGYKRIGATNPYTWAGDRRMERSGQ